MIKTKLVQILLAPGHIDNPFSFGGGLRHGGLGLLAVAALKPIMSFDYMGAAEFECGALPRVFGVIAQNADDYEGFEIKIPVTQIRDPYDLKAPKIKKSQVGKKPKKGATPVEEKAVYVFCKRLDHEEVERRIRFLAANEFDRDRKIFDLKCGTRFVQALIPKEEWHSKPRGWFELDNAFMFFVDKDMFDKTVKMLKEGIDETPEVLAAVEKEKQLKAELEVTNATTVGIGDK